MLTCIASLSKQSTDDDSSAPTKKPQPVKSLTSQFKDMALKASGAYKQYGNPCNGSTQQTRNESTSSTASDEKLRWIYRRSKSFSSSGNNNNKLWGNKELEARVKVISNGEIVQPRVKVISNGEIVQPSLKSNSTIRRVDPVVFVEENEPKEWVAQVDNGVLITFVSLPKTKGGGNDLKRIRFSREMFNKWQAQRWWAENYDRIMELYNVQKLNREAFPLPSPSRGDDAIVKVISTEDRSVTPRLKEQLIRTLYNPTGMEMGCSSWDSLEQHAMQSQQYRDSGGLTSTPKLSTKTETSSMDASIRTSTTREAEHSGEITIVSDLDSEWVEEDEPGVYITIKAHPNGTRELRRVRFSREIYEEMHARLWWEENRKRIHKQYLLPEMVFLNDD